MPWTPGVSPGATLDPMPTTGRTNFTEPKLFFVTTTILNHERLFTGSELCDQVEGMLFRVAKNTKTTLMAHCLMPSHIHLIAGHNDGGPGISKFMQSLKSLVSHMLFKERHGIWMPRFDDVILASEHVFLTKLNYIHENPVRAGLVAKAEDWKWSSVRFWYHDEPSEWLSKDTAWIRDRKATLGETPRVH